MDRFERSRSALLGLLLCACSGDAATTNGDAGDTSALAGSGGASASGGSAGAANGGAAGNTDGGSAGSGGAAGDAQGGAGGEAGASQGWPPAGFIQILGFNFQNVRNIRASFRRAVPPPNGPPPPSRCTSQEMGSCSLLTCTPATDDPVSPAADAPPHAGTIAFNAVDADDPLIQLVATLAPDATSTYPLQDLSAPLRGLETITLSASGGEVPAFEHTWDYPLLLLLTNAGLVDQGGGMMGLNVSKSQDTALTWDRGQEGMVLRVQGDTATTHLGCSFPAQDGTGTIPAALAAGFDGTDLLMATAVTTDIAAGEYTVNVVTAGDVLTPARDAGITGVIVP